MPVNSTGQGHSHNTPVKQDAFRYFMQVHAGVVRGIFAKQWPKIDPCYYYIDTNAGTGYNEDGTPGSTMIAVDILGQKQLHSQIAAIEKDSVSAQMLSDALHQVHPEWSVTAEDNAVALTSDLIPAFPRKDRYGLVYCDPNDMKGLPFAALTTFFRAPQTQRIDVLIHISATTLKRVQGAHGTGYTIPDIIAQVNKRCWYIREGYHNAQWTFLFGLNWPDWKPLQLKVNDPSPKNLQALGLYPVNEPIGKRILEELSLTNAELQKKSQPPLLTVPIVSTSPIRSSRQLGGKS